MNADKKLSTRRGVSKSTPANHAGGPGANPGARSKATYEDLVIALDESLKLQKHYAHLLNIWDGGARKEFSTADEWIARLRETGKITSDISDTAVAPLPV